MIKGWCQTHYQRIRRNGAPDTLHRIWGDDEARFWSYVDRRGDDECWPWTGYVSEFGYAVMNVDGKPRRVHVWAYEHFVGPIPEDKDELDHACHTRDEDCKKGDACPHRRCCNFLQTDRPHLEAVTKIENNHRRNLKFPAALIVGLHARKVAGERTAVLAAEVGMEPRTLEARFRNMAKRGELPPGPGCMKLTDEQIASLHARWKAGESKQDLAAEAGVSRQLLFRRFRRHEAA